MITVTIRANGIPRTVQAMPTQVISDFLESNGINSMQTTVHLNGTALLPSTAAKSFQEAGITENALVSTIRKTANA